MIARPLAVALVAIAVTVGAAAQTADRDETRALHALFDSQWEDMSRRFPEGATMRGDLRYNDKLTDNSEAAIAAWDARERLWLVQARGLRRDRLESTDRVSLDLFIGRLQDSVDEQAFAGYRSITISARGGSQSDVSDFLQAVPVRNVLQTEQLLTRLASVPRAMDEDIALMRRGMAMGWLPARDVLDRAVEQIDVQLGQPLESGPFFDPFRRLGADIGPADRERLRAVGRAAIEAHVLPPMKKLRAFIVDEYRPRAPESGALRNYPDGVRTYDHLVRSRTTTPLDAAQVHAIGLRELASIRAEMEGVMRDVKFAGGFAQFIDYLTTDPKFFHSSPEALLAGYRDIAKRIDAELPRLFAELPRAPYGVRAMPSFRGPDAPEYYNSPAQDGSRPGYFNANIVGWKSRPTWRMATLTAHEGVPGHHLQIARSTELQTLPKFRRSGGYVAFAEGWAVYAESLGREIGLYDDPYSLFGHLQWRAFRAARLMVDTGIHSLGWSRQQSIDFMVERTGMDRGFVTAEVDRYVSDPGQALGYMIGALKIKELRERARAQLGERFDLRRFHNAVIDNGSLPLDVLERLIDEWIAAQKSG